MRSIRCYSFMSDNKRGVIMTATLQEAQREAIKPAQFTVDGPAFAEAIGPVVKVAGGASYCAAVSLIFRDQRVTLAATDFETSVTARVSVKGKKATAIAVSPSRLALFAKTFPFGDVAIDVTEDGVTFQVGATKLTMPPVWGAPKVDIAALESPNTNSAELLAAVRVCSPCASADDARAVLTGVLFETEGNAVATDSYRLAVYRAGPVGLNGLFPAKALKLAAGMFANTEASFEVIDKRLVIRSDSKAFAVRQIDGDYPAWRNLMTGAEATTVVHVARKALMSSLDKVALAGDRKGNNMVCRAQVESETLMLSVITQDVARGSDPLEVTVDGNVALVGFNPDYMRSMLAGVDVEYIAIRIVDALKPFTIVADRVDGDFEFLQMPVRLP